MSGLKRKIPLPHKHDKFDGHKTQHELSNNLLCLTPVSARKALLLSCISISTEAVPYTILVYRILSLTFSRNLDQNRDKVILSAQVKDISSIPDILV